MFNLLCSFCFQGNSNFPLIFDVNNAHYRERGLTYAVVRMLASVGLVTYDGTGGSLKRDEDISLSYFGKTLTVRRGEHPPFLPLGRVMLTVCGYELAKLCEPEEIPGFFEFVIETYRNNGFDAEVGETLP